MNAVIFGAGNIGRGFIGQLLCQSGYRLIYIDIDEKLLALLNEQGGYTVELVDRALTIPLAIGGVSAIDGGDTPAVTQAVAGADLIATAVGVRALPHIAGNLARGLTARNGRPVNVLVCENLRHAGDILRGLVVEKAEGAPLPPTGFVEACIGRMVPVPGADPMTLQAEPYDWLPVDGAALVGDMPPVRRLSPIADFDRYVRRKLYIHNLGHAVCAWMGQRRGYATIDQAAADPDVLSTARSAMLASATALAAEYPSFSLAALTAHGEDILFRFGNYALQDTVRRVGADTERKLGPEDRVVGALRLCQAHDLPAGGVLTALAAGLLFENDDPGTGRVRALFTEKGPEAALRQVSGITDEAVIQAVLKEIKNL